MRILAVALFALLAPALAQAAASTRTADEAAIRELVRSYVNARDLKSPEAIGRLFTEDADQYTTSGEWRRGRAEVVPGTLRSSDRNPGARNIAVQSVRFLTDDAAIVDGPYEISFPGAETLRMWTTLVMTKERDGWRIAAIRNTRPTGAPTAAPRPR